MRRIIGAVAILLRLVAAASAALAVLAGLLAVAPASASTGFSFSEFPVRVAPLDQSDPAISGPYATYTDYSSGNADVYFADVRDGSIHPVATGPGDQQLADISGQFITYLSSNAGASDVFLYDIAAGSTTQLTTTPTQELNPAVSDQLVAYESYATGDADICVYRIASGATTCLHAPGDQVFPVASGTKVAYIDTNDNDAVVVYDADGAASQRVFAGPATSVALDGTHVAFADFTPAGQDLVADDLTTGTTQTLVLPGDQLNPHISGDWVSFEDFNTGTSHIALWNYISGELEHPDVGPSSQTLSALSGNRIVYTDDRNINLDIYALQFTPPAGDTTPPLLLLPAPITTVATSATGAVVTYVATATDDTDPNPTVSCSPPSGSIFRIGRTTVSCSATDVAGNLATGSFDVLVEYATAGLCDGAPGHQILQPINADGSSVFKQGSTVAAKFRVCDANGVSIGTPGVVTSFKLVQTIAGTSSTINEAVDSANPDMAFRWDATAQQWIFNISTKTLSAGTTYAYRITLNDGSTIDFRFGLR